MDRQRSILWCNDNLSRGFINTQYLYKQSKRNLDFLQRLAIDRKLDVHNGCVNTICWNDVGNLILSGSDDQHLIITYPFTKKVAASIHSGHRANIFSAKFLPNTRDNHIVSCSGDGIICFTNVEREDTYRNHTFDCHLGTAYEVMTVPNDSHTFLSCGEDGTVRWFDLRIKDKCNKSDCREDVMINCRRAVTALGINPLVPYQLAVGCSDSSVRMFDRRMLGTKSTGNYTGRGIAGMYSRFTAPNLEGKSHRITSLEFSHDGHEVLVSYSSEYIYLFNMKEDARFQKFSVKEPVKPVEITEDKEKIMPEEEPIHVEDQSPSPTSVEGASGTDRQPPIKRLRLRGDWSDTGPQARPETGDRPHMTLMQRMSDMLTRWFDDNNRRQAGSRSADQSPGGENQPAEGDGQSSTDAAQLDTGEAGAMAEGTEASPSAEAEGGSTEAKGKLSPLPCLRLPVPQGIPESSSSSDSLSSPSSVIAITPCIERRLVTVDEDIAEEQSSTSDNVESSHADQACEGMKSDSDRIEGEKDRSTQQVSDESSPVTEEPATTTSAFEVLETINNEVSSIRARIIASDVEPVISLEYNSEGTTASTIKVGFAPNEGVLDLDNDPVQPITSATVRSSVSPQESFVSGAMVTVNEPVILDAEHTADDAGKERSDAKSSDVPMVESDTVSSSAALTTQSLVISQENLYCGTDLRQGRTTPESLLVISRENTADSGMDVGVDNQSSTKPENILISSQENITDSGMDLATDSEGLPKPVTAGSSTGESNGENIKRLELLGESADVVESLDNSVCDSVTDSAIKHSDSYDSQIVDGKTVECTQAVASEQGEGLSSEATTSEYLSAMDTDVSREPSVEGDRMSIDNQSSLDLEEPTRENSDLSDKPMNSATCDTDGNLPENEEKSGKSDSVEASDRPPDVVTDVAEEDAEAAGPSVTSSRQRRIGYSGPPTGTFQLFPVDHHGDDSDDESDDDDIGIHRIRREGSRWATANAVAKRLQRMYRKRQEEREKEEEAMRNVHQPALKMVFKGHRNARTMIKEANFWGDQYVMSGSDCGHIFIWDRYTADLAMLLEADKHVVNCLQPHPYYPVLASSGIDYDVKIWSPIQRGVGFDLKAAEEVTRRNEVMLEETRDTITVPASFMLRMLASLNNIRTGRREERQNEESSSGED